MSIKLIVIIRDDAPLIHAQGSPLFRKAEIELTPDQVGQIKMRNTGRIGNLEIMESVDRVFLQREEKEKPGAVVVPPGTIVGHQASSKTTGGMNVAIGEKPGCETRFALLGYAAYRHSAEEKEKP